MGSRRRWKTIVHLRWVRREWTSHWPFFLFHFATLGALLWWIPYDRLPWTGVAVAIIAVLAALMSVHSNLRPRHKFIYFALMAALLITEFRAMRKDRDDAQNSQNQFQSQEDQRLAILLGQERVNTQKLLDQENINLNTNLTQDQGEFEGTISALLTTHKQDEEEFANLLKREAALGESQRELSEQYIGRLLPGDSPTPINSCLPGGESPKEGEILTIFGDNAALGVFPLTVLKIGDRDLIGIHKIPESNAVSVSIDFHDSENHVLLRLNENGAVNRSSLILQHPTKNEFLLDNEFGVEFLRITYVNPRVFQIAGKAIYCGNAFPLQSEFMHNSCAAHSNLSQSNSGYVHFAATACPKPQP
jgi:membrane protein implicated in regulation of membrane protease activity